MEHVKDILAMPGHKIAICVNGDLFATEALSIMSINNINCVVVLSQEIIIGIFSEHSFAQYVLRNGIASGRGIIDRSMTTQHISVSPDASVDDCRKLLLLNNLEFIPVLNAGNIVGLVSAEDVSQSLLRDQRLEIEILKDYIYDRRS